MAFAVVQFTKEHSGTVAIVNKKWITPRRSEVFWPPVKGSRKFDRLVLEDSSPDVDKWKLYGIQRIFCETDSLEKAKRKLSIAEYKSDVQTEDEGSKRRIYQRKRLLSSDEEVNDNHVRPPLLKRKLVPELKDEDSTYTTVYNPNTPKSSADDVRTWRDSNLDTPQSQIIEELYDLASAKKQATPKSVHSELTNNQELLSPTSSFTYGQHNSIVKKENSTPKSFQTTYNKTGFEDTVINLLSKIKSQNDTIITFLQGNNAFKHGAAGLREEFQFPIKTLDELCCTEQLLSSQDFKANLVAFLKTVGGRELSYKTSRVMCTVLSGPIAAKFNYYGKRSSKKPFSQLKLCAAVIDALKDTPGATLKDVEDRIKIWLKHAPAREKKKVGKNSPEREMP